MENRELDLVVKVEMRIAVANDDQLESMLKTYLPPLLLKLASEHVSVRNKVATEVFYLVYTLKPPGCFDLSAY